MSDSLAIDGVRIPRFLYGTAWKEDDTERLTLLALRQGFRGIDTANQRKHYHEVAVGRCFRRPERGCDHTRRSLPPDEVHVPRWSGSPSAVRPRRFDRGAGRAVVREFPVPPRRRNHRLVPVARPLDAGGPRQRRLGRVGGHGSHPCERPHADARHQQCDGRATPDPVRRRSRQTAVRAKPMLRLTRLGSRGEIVLHRKRDRVSGLLAADREPNRADTSRFNSHRVPPRLRCSSAGVPFRTRHRDDPPDGDDERRAHACGPGRVRVRPVEPAEIAAIEGILSPR